MANPQNDNFILRGKKTLDARRLRLDGTPWTSVLEVNNAFIDNDRVESQVYFIVDREYWYLGGTENENLVEKKAGTTYEDSDTIEFTATSANVKDNSLDLVKLKDISQHSFLSRTDSGDGPVEEVSLDKVEDLLGITTLKANVDTLETDKADKSTTYTKTEVDNLDTAIVSLLRNGVSSEGDTLNKLYNLILGASGQVTKANITERNAYNVPQGGQVFVLDDGDGKWALYKATTSGVGATYVKLSDPDLLNAVMTGAMIKVAYSAEPNAFNDALKVIYDNAVTAINSVVTQLSTYLVDNLSSTATDKALTANQGKVLDSKITVLNNAISTINTALSNKQNTLTEDNFGAFNASVSDKPIQATSDEFGYMNIITGKWVKQAFANLNTFLRGYFQVIKKILSSDKIAVNGEIYHVKNDTVFTDPAVPIEGDGYYVFVVKGLVTLGGLEYTAGRYLFRLYDGTVWKTHIINDADTRQPKIKVIYIGSDTTLSDIHNGCVLIVTATVVLTIPSGLDATFTSCVIDVKVGQCTIGTAGGVTATGYYSLILATGDTTSIVKESDGTNNFRIK